MQILRIYWDDQTIPSVECRSATSSRVVGRYAHVNSLAVCVNPGSAFNCYWEMPFRKKCRITFTNLDDKEMVLFYQINYTLTTCPRTRPTSTPSSAAPTRFPTRPTTPSSTASRARGSSSARTWPGGQQQRLWGEGEIKFFHGRRHPVADDLWDRHGRLLLRLVLFHCQQGAGQRPRSKGDQYQEFSTPYAGMPQVIRPDGAYDSNTASVCTAGTLWTRSGSTRPARHHAGPRLAKPRPIPAHARRHRLGRLLDQTLPTAPFPELPDKDHLEVV